MFMYKSVYINVDEILKRSLVSLAAATHSPERNISAYDMTSQVSRLTRHWSADWWQVRMSVGLIRLYSALCRDTPGQDDVL